MTRLLTTKLVPTISLGQGWSFARGTIQTFAPGSPLDRPDNNFGDVMLSVVYGAGSLMSNVGCDASVSMRAGKALKLNAALSVAKKTLWKSRSLYVLLQATIQTGVREIVQAPSLLPEPEGDVSAARANQEASYAFLEKYGNYFVKTALIGSSLTCVIRLECISDEDFERISSQFDGTYGGLSVSGTASVSLSKMIHRASHSGSLQVQVFGSGGATSTSAEMGSDLSKLIEDATEEKSLSVVAQAIQSALKKIDGAGGDSIYGYEIIPMEAHLGLKSPSINQDEVGALLDLFQIVMDEKARTEVFKLKYGAYYDLLDRYIREIKQVDSTVDIEERLAALEKRYELDNGIDIQPHKVVTSPSAVISILPNELGRWLVPTSPVVFEGFVHGHELSAVSASQGFAIPDDAAGFALEIKAFALPELYQWRPGMPAFAYIGGGNQTFEWYRLNGVLIQIMCADASIPFQFMADGRQIRCDATQLAGKTVRLVLKVDQSHLPDRLLHRARAFATTYRLGI